MNETFLVTILSIISNGLLSIISLFFAMDCIEKGERTIKHLIIFTISTVSFLAYCGLVLFSNL